MPTAQTPTDLTPQPAAAGYACEAVLRQGEDGAEIVGRFHHPNDRIWSVELLAPGGAIAGSVGADAGCSCGGRCGFRLRTRRIPERATVRVRSEKGAIVDVRLRPSAKIIPLRRA